MRPRTLLYTLVLVALLLSLPELSSRGRWRPLPTAAGKTMAEPVAGTPTPSPTPPPTLTPSPTPSPAPTATATLTPVPMTPIAPGGSVGLGLPPNRVNIILLGMDRWDIERRGRTDTMILVSIDPDEPSVRMVSIPRDLWVRLPWGGEHKLNTAYPSGGFEGLRSTLRLNLGISVDRFVAIDFTGMRRLIDALGGVDVLVRCPLYDVFPDPDYPTLTYTLDLRTPGWYHLDGKLAMGYMRSRLTTSDYHRARRQQQVLRAMFRKLRSENLLPRIPELWPAIRRMVHTNLSLGEVVWLAWVGRRLSEDRIAHAYLHATMVSSRTLYLPPPTTGVTQPLELWIYVQTGNTIPFLRRFLTEPLPNPAERTPVELINATGEEARGDIAEEMLAEAGFRVTRRIELRREEQPTRVIMLREGGGSEAGRLLRALRVSFSRLERAPEPDATVPYRIWLGPDFNPCP
jgi:LCP family protein required for cell wall assembly